MIYECSFNDYKSEEPNDYIRVTKETYDIVTEYPYYKLRSKCRKNENFKNMVCHCPSGYSDYLCSSERSKKCFVRITSPDLASGCTAEDSFDYVYSIKGFDPCFHYDFKTKQKFTYLLDCRAINNEGQVLRQGHPEEIGFNYSHVVANGTKDAKEFKYLAVNKESGLKLMNTDSVTFSFSFQDWKYLSNKISFDDTITDIETLVGNEEQSIEVDFRKLVQQDKKGRSLFEVAGRVYFEAKIYKPPRWQSFVTNGFFEREGYIEPQRDANTFPIYLYVVAPLAALFFLLICICWIRRRNKIRLENEKLDAIQKKRDRLRN